MPAPRRKARIEIIPLIDIMFFLLASFMLIALAMIRLQGMAMTLPSGEKPPAAALRQISQKPEVVKIDVGANGGVFDRKGSHFPGRSRKPAAKEIRRGREGK